ncbi:membrane associated rhomboid family serine protease [Desulfosalsimonas propionicica]|uniref:Membrane associated rhomboid family serine protease n=1 Tax=Desulfosalsimonas propionicica TaxID=332175 RepID=A0A7W0HKS6_9BACT|nr:rhomboid family intramembrane serine protease [Desulfosalsimonas propionicica]MBA2881540.1 membrane associated rhomboid family serine protease [Desulfosalsimonas propionicica]
MIELYDNMSADSADLCGLILKASGIPFRVRKDSNGWGIWVAARDFSRARCAVDSYFRENRPSDVIDQNPLPEQDHGYAGIWTAAFMAAVYAGVSRTADIHAVWNDFGASAWKIMDGEFYRTVTALMLHADAVHLLGNMAGLAVFATAVCHVAGWGAGMLMILAAGAGGNMVNAVMYESGHVSIGASTAVFGAIGILSGYQFLRRRVVFRKKAGAWLPLACGLALLGFLGAGEHVDLAAHLFGFLVGIFIGIGYAGVHKTISTRGQRLCMAVCSAVVAGAWAVGTWKQLF